MKLLVSDYDGTLKSDITNLYLNIDAIDKFRSEGNKFAIATGRYYESIRREIIIFNIDFDYLICNNGAIVFNKNSKIINKKSIDEQSLKYIYNSINKKDINDIELFNTHESTNIINNILTMYIKFNKLGKSKKFKCFIDENFPELKCYIKQNRAYISRNVSKANGINFIKEIENLDKEDIITVGDAANDMEMLKEYNGYKMLYSYPSLWFKDIKTTKEVHTLIKKIKNN